MVINSGLREEVITFSMQTVTHRTYFKLGMFSICLQAEARLAAKRAARAEARDIRMRELERQQKEVVLKCQESLQTCAKILSFVLQCNSVLFWDFEHQITVSSLSPSPSAPNRTLVTLLFPMDYILKVILLFHLCLTPHKVLV